MRELFTDIQILGAGLFAPPGGAYRAIVSGTAALAGLGVTPSTRAPRAGMTT